LEAVRKYSALALTTHGRGRTGVFGGGKPGGTLRSRTPHVLGWVGLPCFAETAGDTSTAGQVGLTTHTRHAQDGGIGGRRWSNATGLHGHHRLDLRRPTRMEQGDPPGEGVHMEDRDEDGWAEEESRAGDHSVGCSLTASRHWHPTL